MIGCYRSCRTITVSNSTKEELVREFSFNEKNITVIENACDIVPVESIDFDAKKNKILFLWRLMPIKRAEDTIHAFSVFYRSNTRFSDYSLDIIGNNQDKEYFRKLQGLVQDLSLENSVHFLGQKDKESLSKILLEYKVILVPSMKEWFWLIVLEANSYGIPALWYNVSGLRDSIVDGENWFLISDGSYTEMGENLSELCSNIDLYKKLSIQSLTRAKNHPNWDINTQARLAIISQK